MAWFCVKPVKYCPPPKPKCDTKGEVKKTVDIKPKCEIKYTAPKLYCLTKSYEAPKYAKPAFCKPIYNGDA